MSKTSDAGDVDALQRRLAQLEQQLAEAERRLTVAQATIRVLVGGEGDTVAPGQSPVLLKRSQDALVERERLFRAVFDGSLDGLLLADDDGRYVDVNAAACAMFGRPKAELIGKRPTDFAVPGTARDGDFETLRREGAMRASFDLLRPDGERRVLEGSASANILPGLHLAVVRDVTEHRREQARFRILVEKSSEGITLTRPDGTITYASPGVERVLGHRPEEMVGQKRLDLLRPGLVLGDDDWREPLSFERQVQHRDGSLRWIHVTKTNLVDDPDVGAVVANFRDVTKRHHAETELRSSRYFLEAAQEIAGFGSWVSGFEPADAVHWSRTTCSIFGVDEGTPVTVATFFAAVHADDRAAVEAAARAAVDDDVPYDVEHRIVQPGGAIRWVHQRATVERDEHGVPLRMIGIIDDVTDAHLDRERSEQMLDELQRSEERYRQIVESTSEGVVTADTDGVVTFMNRRLATMLGTTPEDAVGRPVFEYVVPSDHNEVRRQILQRQAGLGDRYELRARRTDGAALLVALTSTPLRDDHGTYVGALALITDITARAASEEMQARLVAIVESSVDAITSCDLEMRITSWNRAAETLYGYAAHEVIGRRLPLIDARELPELMLRLMRGDVVSGHQTLRLRKDGSTVPIALTLSLIRNAAGSAIGLAAITRDLTAQHEMEERLRQAQRMDAIGNLAGGIAHDFNNLLSVILLSTALLKTQLGVADPRLDSVNDIQDAGDRAVVLTRQLLAFGRRQVLQPRVVDLGEILMGMERLLGRLIGAQIELSLLVAPDLGPVLADPGQLEQVLVNLVVNARDAMPRGGRITIDANNVDDAALQSLSQQQRVDLHLDLPGSPAVLLTVQDTGVGMDEATLGRIFEPFFTTKEKGRGTGLGLSTVVGIVAQSQGFITVQSKPGQGSKFLIALPRAVTAEEASASDVTPTSTAALASTEGRPLTDVDRGSETLLVVEDDGRLRGLLVTMLQRLGYHVLEAANGGEALLVCEQTEGGIDLLLCDVVMPKMGGRQLADRLLRLKPAMKVLFISGYVDDALLRETLGEGSAFLQKPLERATLANKLRELLGPATES